MTRYLLCISGILLYSQLVLKSLNIVECCKFWVLLLLLQNDLKESMILHHTKLCELIIEAWKHDFQVLNLDLAVHLPS